MSINPLPLVGWDETSTWGVDNGSFYAQLTPNGVSDHEGPQVWVAPPEYIVRDASGLARTIAKMTGSRLDDVLVAMRWTAGTDEHEASD